MGIKKEKESKGEKNEPRLNNYLGIILCNFFGFLRERGYLGGRELEVAEEKELEVDLVLFGIRQEFLVLAGCV